MNKIKYYLQRIYRLALSFKKQEELVWKELKKLHADADWKHGVYEKDKYIETIFELGKEQAGDFYYMIYEGNLHCRVKILENYPTELTTDLFILAAHFNNILNNGVVIVNVQGCYVEYHQKRDLLISYCIPVKHMTNRGSIIIHRKTFTPHIKDLSLNKKLQQ